MSSSDYSYYRSSPGLTRYVSTDRYENPKEDFKAILAALRSVVPAEPPLRVADIGCGNGELLYLLHRTFSEWELHGYDYSREYIDTARGFEGLRGVEFHHGELDGIQGSFDVVLATCFLPLFQDAIEPLEKMLSLCSPGGWVMATGLFNPWDIDVRVEICDNTHPETAGRWRSDFNRHSRRRITEALGGAASSIEFRECTYDVEIPRDDDHPIRVWTSRDGDGRTLLVNGAFQIVNQSLLVIQK